MTERPMTPEEMQDFERNVLHHEDDETTPAAPASEPEVGRKLDRERDAVPPVLPAAD